MAASQTIDKLQFGVNEIAKKDSGSSSNADKANNFNDIFEDINKTYSSKPEEVQNTSKNEIPVNDSNSTSVKKAQEPAQKETPEVQSSSGNKINNNVENTTENTKAMGTTNVEQPPVEKEDLQEIKVAIENIQDEVLIETPLVDITNQVKGKPVKTDLNTDAQNDLKPVVEVIQPQNAAIFEAQDEAQITLGVEAEVKAEVKAEPKADDSDSSIPASPINIAVETLDLIAQAVIADFVAPVNASQVQTNNQQATLPEDSQVSAISGEITLNVPNAQKNIAGQEVLSVNTNINSNLPLNNIQNQETQAPLVQVATDAIVSEVKVGGQNTELAQNSKAASSNTSLTQEVLDSLDVKVTAVKAADSSTSDSNSNLNQNLNQNQNSKNLLAQQNAQEQAIKLELQNNNSQSVVTSEITVPGDSAVQASLGGVNNLASTTQAQSVNSAQVPKELSQADIMSQIDKQLNLKSSQAGETTKVSIVLRPEHLGKIELELISTKDGLSAKMITDNAQVKELLDKSLDSLRDTLGAQGLSVNNVSVKVSEVQKQDTMFSFDGQANQENQQQQNAKQSSAGSAAFEEDLGELTEEDILATEVESQVNLEEIQNVGKVDYKV